jgi:AraC-like DNA-binding protein
MHAFFKMTTSSSNAARMAHNDRIAKAIDDLESQNRPNIAATAKKWKIDRSTLSRRFRGKTGSKEEATSCSRKKLSTTQEEALIAHINRLSDRGLPPTPQIVKNLAEELVHEEIGKNWVSRFCQRYANRLSSVYLRTIDHKRKIADNSHHFEHYFNTVSVFLSFY